MPAAQTVRQRWCSAQTLGHPFVPALRPLSAGRMREWVQAAAPARSSRRRRGQRI